ncbi:MAG: immune inhibitor A domain-containing protein [Heyndrickxia sp.]
MEDWKKKFSVPLLLAGLVISSFAGGIHAEKAAAPKVKSSAAIDVAPIDLGVANNERLIDMLKKNGTIAADASPAEEDKALQEYLHKMALAAGSSKETNSFARNAGAVKEAMKQKMDSNGIYKGKGNKNGQAKQSVVAPVQQENWNGKERKDEVLVLLIDFPDLPHGQVTKDETDMYYSGPDAYSHQHYQDMIFGENGYEGPDGKTKISMKQFYEQQSGGSYTVDGAVAGWYTAKNPAAYYGKHSATGGNDANPRALIREALAAAAKDPSVGDLNNYDQEDPYDLDGDGNTREPDGIIDHLMVIHSGVGEEAGGGKIGADAIWSHSWDLGGVAAIPNTKTDVPYWGGALAGFAYTVEPEDGAAGVFAHEFGHNLGLPDEYDTLYSGSGEPVSNWSIMSSGSWTGAIPGTEPSGFSPYDKEYLQASMTTPGFTPNWQSGTEVDFKDVTSNGTELLLDEASSKGTNNDVVKINLPDKKQAINKPTSGVSEYFGGSDNNLDTKMTTTIDLTKAKTAELSFKTWYSIEQDFDYAYVEVNGKAVEIPSISTKSNPNDANLGNGITGNSDGWKEAKVDLTPFAGQKVQISFHYKSDAYVAEPGFYVDDIKVTADGKNILSDDAEGTPQFDLNGGFKKSDGNKFTKHYYLLEWRTHNGSDSGLANINRRGTMLSFDPGLVVWYVDNAFDNNWTGPGYHPGDGFLGVVDADQHNNVWHDKLGTVCGANKCLGSNSYQVHDAAFNTEKGTDVTIGDKSFYMKDNFTQKNAIFDDSQNYSNSEDPDVGRNITSYGLKVRVTGQSSDGTVGKILIYK